MPIQVIHGNPSPINAAAEGAAQGVQSYLDTTGVLRQMEREAQEFQQIKALRDQQIRGAQIANETAGFRLESAREDRPLERESAALGVQSQRIGNQRQLDAMVNDSEDRLRGSEQLDAAQQQVMAAAQMTGAFKPEELDALGRMDPAQAMEAVRFRWLGSRAELERQGTQAYVRDMLGATMPPEADQNDPRVQQLSQTMELLAQRALIDPEGTRHMVDQMVMENTRQGAESAQRATIAEMWQNESTAFARDPYWYPKVNLAIQGFLGGSLPYEVARQEIDRAQFSRIHSVESLASRFGGVDPQTGQLSPMFMQAVQVQQEVFAGIRSPAEGAKALAAMQSEMQSQMFDLAGSAPAKPMEITLGRNDKKRVFTIPPHAQGNGQVMDQANPEHSSAFSAFVTMAKFDLDTTRATDKVLERAVELAKAYGGWVFPDEMMDEGAETSPPSSRNGSPAGGPFSGMPGYRSQ